MGVHQDVADDGGGSLSLCGKALLCLAIAFHLSLLISWRFGFWNRFTFDATATHGRRGWDFYAMYQAGHNVLTGVSAYQSDNDKIEVVVPVHTPYRYLPPPAYTLGVLLNAIPPLWAFRLWVMVTEIVLLGCACASWRLGSRPGERVVLASMWLVSTPYYLEIYLGQFSVVQGALVFGMMLLAQTRSGGWTPDLLWIASLLWKQSTGLFLPLYLRLRRWRALGAATLAVVATAVPYFLMFPSAWPAFSANFVGGAPSHQLGNHGFRQLLFSVASALLPKDRATVFVWVDAIWVIAAIGVGLWVTFADRDPDPVLHLCLWTVSFFLLYHHVWEHHYVLLLPVLVMLYRRTHSSMVLLLYGLVAIWTPYVLMDPRGMAAYHAPMRWTPLQPRILDVLYHSSKAVPACLLWLYIISLIRRSASMAVGKNR